MYARCAYPRAQCLNQCDDKHVMNALKTDLREADESVLQVRQKQCSHLG